ncbi:hypothetical protein DDT91_10525 [Algoriphagus sp. AK58]|nr:hypothetical protein [Algoriphagus sp. AK58]
MALLFQKLIQAQLVKLGNTNLGGGMKHIIFCEKGFNAAFGIDSRFEHLISRLRSLIEHQN